MFEFSFFGLPRPFLADAFVSGVGVPLAAEFRVARRCDSAAAFSAFFSRFED
jgi:hypothetical protein